MTDSNASPAVCPLCLLELSGEQVAGACPRCGADLSHSQEETLLRHADVRYTEGRKRRWHYAEVYQTNKRLFFCSGNNFTEGNNDADDEVAELASAPVELGADSGELAGCLLGLVLGAVAAIANRLLHRTKKKATPAQSFSIPLDNIHTVKKTKNGYRVRTKDGGSYRLIIIQD